jgi:oligopeptide transport system substrate-binding protein
MTASLIGMARQPAAASSSTTGAQLPVLQYDAVVGASGWPPTIDPAIATDGVSIGVFDLIYAGMVKLNYATYAIQPDMATSWKVSKNHKTYWFSMRPNAKFSNGDPVTAQDEVWTLTRMLAKSTNSPIAMLYFGHILGAKKLNDGKTNRLQGVKAVNAHLLQVTLDKPIAYFLKTFSYWSNKVLDPRVVAGHKPGVYLTNDCSANIATGPFMFKCRNAGADKSSFFAPGTTPTITLVPNPHYYGRKPHIQIVIRPYASTETGFAAYRANQLDMTPLPAPDVSHWRGNPQLYDFPAPSIIYLLPNFQAAPFNNIHCRLAVSYAIDRDTLNNVVLHGTQRSIYSMVPKPIQAWYPGDDNPHFSLSRAKQELAQCPGGLHGLSLPYWKSGTDADNMFSAIQNMLSQAGIDIKPKGMSFNDWLTVVHEPENQSHNTIVEDEWGMDFPDPEDFCSILLHSGSVENAGQFQNKTYDHLVDTADVTLNQEARTKLYIKAQHLALSTGGWIMVGQQVQDTLVKPYVHGMVPAYGQPGAAPRNGDWSNVTISPH